MASWLFTHDPMLCNFALWMDDQKPNRTELSQRWVKKRKKLAVRSCLASDKSEKRLRRKMFYERSLVSLLVFTINETVNRKGLLELFLFHPLAWKEIGEMSNDLTAFGLDKFPQCGFKQLAAEQPREVEQKLFEIVNRCKKACSKQSRSIELKCDSGSRKNKEWVEGPHCSSVLKIIALSVSRIATNWINKSFLLPFFLCSFYSFMHFGSPVSDANLSWCEVKGESRIISNWSIASSPTDSIFSIEEG